MRGYEQNHNNIGYIYIYIEYDVGYWAINSRLFTTDPPYPTGMAAHL